VGRPIGICPQNKTTSLQESFCYCPRLR